MAYRNWKAIAHLPDSQLMMLLLATKNRETLAGLAAGFPDLFTDEPAEFDGVWPRSVIMGVMAEWDSESGKTPDEFLREHLGLPIVCVTFPDSGIDGLVIDTEQLDQLRGALPDMHVSYYDFGIIPSVLVHEDGRRFYALQSLHDCIFVLPTQCVDCEK